MRFSKAQRRRSNSDEAILPLTNIVFLLLIFFLLAGRLTVPQAFNIMPPRSASGAPATHGLEVEITADGQLALAGQPVDRDKLRTQVHARLQRQPHTALRLKADGQDNAAQVVAVMRILHAAGADKLRLITLNKSP